MRTISQTEALLLLPSLLEQVAEESVAIQQDGREIAYLISPDEYALGTGAGTEDLLHAYEALAAEIALNVQRKELDLGELMRSLDRKAS